MDGPNELNYQKKNRNCINGIVMYKRFCAGPFLSFFFYLNTNKITLSKLIKFS